MILIPEIPFDIDEVCTLIRHRHERGRYFSIVVAAEGATPEGGDDGADRPARSTSSVTPGSAESAIASSRRSRSAPGYETRATVLGHVQRGGTPTAVRPGARDPASGSPRSTPRTTAPGG